MKTTRTWYVERLLAAGSVNLLGGPSGSGKTRLLFEELESIEKKKKFLGFPTSLRQSEISYIAYDRPADAVCELIHMMDLSISGISISSNFSDLSSFSFPVLPPSIKLLVIDGLECLVPGGRLNDFDTVSKFLRRLTLSAVEARLSILGLMGTAKFKVNNAYASSRERLGGSAAWSRFAESVLILEPKSMETPEDGFRILKGDPRLSSPFVRFYKTLENGRLAEYIPNDAQTDQLLSILETLPESFKVQDLTEATGMTPKHAFLACERLEKNHFIQKTSHGTYRRLIN